MNTEKHKRERKGQNTISVYSSTPVLIKPVATIVSVAHTHTHARCHTHSRTVHPRYASEV